MTTTKETENMKTTVAKKKVPNTVKVTVPFKRDVLARIRKAAHKIRLTVPKYIAIAAESDRPF